MRIILALLLTVPVLGIAGGVYWLRHRNPALCVRCRYPRTGLGARQPCPECGVAHDARRRRAKAAGFVVALSATVVAWMCVRITVEWFLPLPRHVWFRGGRMLGVPNAYPRVDVTLEWTQWNAAARPTDRFWLGPASGNVVLSLTSMRVETLGLQADCAGGPVVLTDGRGRQPIDSANGSPFTLAQWLVERWPECSAGQANALTAVIAAAPTVAHEETAGDRLAQVDWSNGTPRSEFSSINSGTEPLGAWWREPSYLLVAAIPGVWLAWIVFRGPRSAPPLHDATHDATDVFRQMPSAPRSD